MRSLPETFAPHFEADLAVEYLSEFGIAAGVVADDAGGAIPSVEAIGRVHVDVADGDLVRATGLILEWKESDCVRPKPLSTREKALGWIVGGFLVGVLAWLLGSILWRGMNRVRPTERPEFPPRAEAPW